MRALEIIDAWTAIASTVLRLVSFCDVIVNQYSPVLSGVSPWGTVITNFTVLICPGMSRTEGG